MGQVADEPLRLRVHDGREFLGNPRELATVGHHHAEKPKIFGVLVEVHYDPGDKAQHLLHVAPGFDADRERVLEMTGDSEEHLPKDFLLAGKLVVERSAGHARGFRQLIHAHRTEAALQEQASGGLDDRLPRPAAPGLRVGLG